MPGPSSTSPPRPTRRDHQRQVADGSDRIVMVTGYASIATAVEAIEKGANGFLCKPFSDRQLNDALAELLREV